MRRRDDWGVFAFLPLLGDPVERLALPGTGAALGAGTRMLTGAGNDSAGIASCGGSLAVMPISPVPEPTGFARMLAGASGALFLARRRRNRPRGIQPAVACRARASSSSRSRALRVISAARVNSTAASVHRPSLASRSPRTLGSR